MIITEYMENGSLDTFLKVCFSFLSLGMLFFLSVPYDRSVLI